MPYSLDPAACARRQLADLRARQHEPRQPGVPPLAEMPTQEQPGTEAKLRVMEKRVARGRQPRHPLDRTCLADSED